MRYLARRILSGEWLTRDLPLADVERTRTLSGPSIIKGKINPELRDLIHSDGMRLLEEWATFVYAVDEDTGHLRLGGIVVPSTEYEESETTLICMGVAGYPQGFIYEDSRLWGPSTTLPRPDPIQIYRDLWDYVQSFENSDLGVEVVGTRKSDERVGDNAEPYRLRWWEAPDVGEEMDSLAESTPFDYVEHYKWANSDHTEVTHQVEVGWPRLGAARGDLRFALGENVVEPTPLKSPESFANNIIGLGNGQGATMVTARASVDEGRLRRTAVFTDKTMRSKDRLDRKIARLLNRDLRGGRVEIDQIVVADHPNAPLSAIRPGDDILISTYVPAYGGVEQWGRVVGITQGEDDSLATLSLIPSDKFQYSAGRPEEQVDPYVPVCQNGTPVLPLKVSAPFWANVPGSSSSAYQVNVEWSLDVPASAQALDWGCYVIIAATDGNDAGTWSPAGYGNDDIDPDSMPNVGFNWTGFTATPGGVNTVAKIHNPNTAGAAAVLVSPSQYSGYDPLPAPTGEIIGVGFYVISAAFPSLHRQLPQHDGSGSTLGRIGVNAPDTLCAFYWGPQIAETGDSREIPMGPMPAPMPGLEPT